MIGNRGHGEKRSRKQEALIAALLSTSTLAEAAQIAGVSEATARRWLRREDFQAHYKAARQEALSHAIARMQQAGNRAVDTLTEIMSDPTAPAAARVTAARTVLEQGRAATLEELEAKYHELALVVRELDRDVHNARSRQAYS